MASKITLLIAVITLFHISQASAKAPADVSFYGINTRVVSHYERNGTFIRSFNACKMEYSNKVTEATVGGDGKIWSGGSLLHYFDPETLECGSVDVNGTVSSVVASPRGKHIYYLFGKNVSRYNIALKKSEPVLFSNSSISFEAFVFIGSKFYISITPNLFFVEYEFDSEDNLNVNAPKTTVKSYRSSQAPVLKMKKCPTVSPQWICWQSYTNALQVGKIYNVSSFQSTAELMNIGQIGDFWTAPWNFMYASLPGFTSLFLQFNVTTLNSFPLQNYVIIGAYNATKNFNGFVALIDAPQISITNDCNASIGFNSYSWTTRYMIQLFNEATGLFEYRDEKSNPAQGPQTVQLSVLCPNPTIRFRLYYEGNLTTSDPIYSVPKTVNCPCYVAPPIVAPPISDVVPILECVEQTEQGPVVHLGYNNAESSVAEISVGNFNKFSDVENRNQPTSFAVGRSSYWPASAFSFAFNGSVTWLLSTYSLTIDTSNSRLFCPQNVSFALTFTAQNEVTAQNIEDIRLGVAGLMNVTANRVTVADWSSTPVNKKRASSLVEIRFRILPAQNGNETSSAEAVRTIVNLMSQSPGTINQVINTGSNSDRSVQSVTTTASGVEVEGTAPQPIAVNPNPNPNPNPPVKVTSSGALLQSLCVVVLAAIFVAL